MRGPREALGLRALCPTEGEDAAGEPECAAGDAQPDAVLPINGDGSLELDPDRLGIEAVCDTVCDPVVDLRVRTRAGRVSAAYTPTPTMSAAATIVTSAALRRAVPERP